MITPTDVAFCQKKKHQGVNTSPITIKEIPLFTVPVFSETAEPICKVGIPIESSWHGQRPNAARFPNFASPLNNEGRELSGRAL